MNRSPLTELEVEVALLVAAGLTDREIAHRLDLPVRTARSHVVRIGHKLGVVGSRADAARRALSGGPLDGTRTMGK